MNSNFKTVNPSSDLKEVFTLIYSDKKGFFPVVEKDKLLGAIDAVNLNEYILLQAKLAH